MHSGTKCFGGHYDLLCGTLSIQPAREESWFKTLHEQRTILGSVLGSMEVWLGLRSLRTLELRVRRQSENATALVLWLYECLKSEFDYVVKKIVAAGDMPVFRRGIWISCENENRMSLGRCFVLR